MIDSEELARWCAADGEIGLAARHRTGRHLLNRERGR